MLKTKTIEVPDVIYTKEDDIDRRLEVYRDQHPQDPREWNEFSTMECKWNNYLLGDKQVKTENFEDWEDVKWHIEDKEEVLAILPLYVYEHSMITISTTPFQSRWDSGKAGWIYTTKEQVEKCGLEDRSREELEKLLKDDVETYDHFIRGEVWRFEYYENGKQIDACGGFIGEWNEIEERISEEVGIENLSSWKKEDNY